ncbi:MAG: nuclear transport factor 2 family protein [Caldilineaceae bacterium]|nr:nuclear transport factor 2 family protein [Caldilineaceae bacterium]
MTADEAMSVQTRAAVDAFNDAFNRHDIAGVMALMAADCVFENTYPPPDGTRVVGAMAVRETFAEFFRQSPQARFEWEEIVALDDRCAVRWVYHWGGAHPGHVRGIDLFRLRNGKIAEKLSYVKG